MTRSRAAENVKVVVLVSLLLPAGRIQVLAEVALLIEQAAPTSGTPRSLADFR